MASIRKRGENSYLIVVSRGYDYEGNRLKSAQKTVHPPVELKPKQREKWLQEQAVLFEREVHHTPEPVNKSITLAKYIDHWLAEVAPKKLAKTTYSRDQQDVRRILPALGHYKLTDLRKEVIRDFYEEMRKAPKLTDGKPLAEKICRGHPQYAVQHFERCGGGGVPAAQPSLENVQTPGREEEAPGGGRRTGTAIDCRIGRAKPQI